MEECGLLDPTNECHRFCLHYVFLPRINRALYIFKLAWNSHRIRTVHNATPQQLFTDGAIRMHMTELDSIHFPGIGSDNYSDYGVEDEAGSEDENSDIEGVPVPEIDYQYTQFMEMLGAESDNHAIDIYQRTLLIITHCMEEIIL